MCDCPAEKELLEGYIELRRNLRNVLYHHAVYSNPIVEDEWIIEQFNALLESYADQIAEATSAAGSGPREGEPDG